MHMGGGERSVSHHWEIVEWTYMCVHACAHTHTYAHTHMCSSTTTPSLISLCLWVGALACGGGPPSEHSRLRGSQPCSPTPS